MPSSLSTHYRALRLLLIDATEAVSAYKRATCTEHLVHLLQLQVKYQQCISDLADDSPFMSADPLCFQVQLTSMSQTLAREHLRFVSAFSEFVTALLCKLDRQLWVDQNSTADSEFSLLWGFLLDTCSAFNMLPSLWPKDHVSDNSLLYPALNQLMSFLLPLTCPDTRPWASPLGRAVTTHEAFAMTRPALIALTSICEGCDPVRVPASIRSLPPAYIDTLCYLACEAFDRSLTNEVLDEFYRSLCMDIAICVSIAKGECQESDIAPFHTPAILEVAKRGYLAMQGHLGVEHKQHARQLLVVLFTGPQPQTTKPTPPQSVSTECSAGTLAKRAPRVLTPEYDVLRLLCKISLADPNKSMMEIDCALIIAIVQRWPVAASGQPRSKENICSMLQIMHFCSAYMGTWMKQMRQQRLDQRLQHGAQSPRPAGAADLVAARQSSRLREVVQCVLMMVCTHASDLKEPDVSAMDCWRRKMLQLPPFQRAKEGLIVGDLINLLQWRRSNGSLVVLEATMRNIHTGEFSCVVSHAELAAQTALPLRMSPNQGALETMLCIAATTFKLIYMHTVAVTKMHTHGTWNPAVLPTQLTKHRVTGCMKSMCTVIICLDCTTQSEIGDTDAHLKFPGLADQRSVNGPLVSPGRTLMLRRVATTLLLCLLQLCAWRTCTEHAEHPLSGKPAWYAELGRNLGKLSGDLGRMSGMMLQGPGLWGPDAGETISSEIYERFTTPSSQKRLLPGCCRLGCTNIDSPTEAALGTLLCSGCRKARYCCEKCQRAAWVQGHRLYCGGKT